MDELHLTDEQLTTRDIAYPARTGANARAAVIDPVVDDGDHQIVERRLDTENRSMETREETAGREISESAGPLFPDDEMQGFRSRWDRVQTSFVDEPRQAVQQADSLVASVVQRIAEQFSAEREQLEKQWDSGSDVSTEDLRQAMKRYRSFFDRLLTF
jgi:serine phosphatase RsbU (regulator of sigma subunit)